MIIGERSAIDSRALPSASARTRDARSRPIPSSYIKKQQVDLDSLRRSVVVVLRKGQAETYKNGEVEFMP